MTKFFRNLTLKQEYRLLYKEFEPQSFKEIIGNQELVNTLALYINTGNIPNLLISGPNGSGKTILIKIFLKTYLQANLDKACLIINGAINRGKDVVTNTNGEPSDTGSEDIQSFIKNKITLPPEIKKIVLIHNFDHMTKDAQNALRSIIEKYAKTTRFIFICNDLDSIIEPIHSRCTSLRTVKLSDYEIKSILQRIIDKLKISESRNSSINESSESRNSSINDNLLDIICLISEGDIKQAINYLQIIINAPDTSIDTFFKIFNLPSIYTIKQIILKTNTDDRHKAFDQLNELINNGYNPSDIMNLFIQTLTRMTDEEISIDHKIKYLQRIALCMYNYELVPSVSFVYLIVTDIPLEMM